MAAHSITAFRPARCPVARCNAQKKTLRPRFQAATAAAAGTTSPAAAAQPADAIQQHTEAPLPRQDAHAAAFNDSESCGPRTLSSGSKMRAYATAAASAAAASASANAAASQTAHPHQQEYPTAGWASVGPALLRQQALSRSSVDNRRKAAPATYKAPSSRSSGTTFAADASASPSLRGMSLLAAAGLLRASYPATFDALGAATRATLDDPGAAHAWLCHLLAAHGEPLSLLAPGGVTALVATDAGLLGLLEVSADAADSLQRAGRHSEALATALAGLQVACRLRFGRHSGPGPFLPAIHAFQRVVDVAACQ